MAGRTSGVAISFRLPGTKAMSSPRGLWPARFCRLRNGSTCLWVGAVPSWLTSLLSLGEVARSHWPAWREWVQMPHRKEAFNRLVMRMFLAQAAWRDMIADCRRTWQARLDAATEDNPAPAWLARIASEFDPANWHIEESEGRTLII